MSKHRRIALLAALILCAVCFIVLALLAQAQAHAARDLRAVQITPPSAQAAFTARPAHSPAPTAPVEPLPSAPPAEDIYIVKPYHGCLAIYREGDSAPLEITETPLDSLRQADQSMIRAGLRLRGWQELAAFLEDFS